MNILVVRNDKLGDFITASLVPTFQVGMQTIKDDYSLSLADNGSKRRNAV